ncbi:MAG: HAMP domain-containing sensor histidine kinase [Pirellulales bacterium]
MNPAPLLPFSVQRPLPLLDDTVEQLTCRLTGELERLLEQSTESMIARSRCAPAESGAIAGSEVAIDGASTGTLGELLRGDPGLLAWGLLHAWWGEEFEPYTVDELSGWLEPQFVELLAGDLSQPVRDRPNWQFLPADSSWRARCVWARLIVRMAVDQVPYRQAASADHLTMLMAVHLVTVESDQPWDTSQLPAWMLDELAQLRQPAAGTTGLAGVLRWAIDRLGEFETWRRCSVASWLHTDPPAERSLVLLSRLAGIAQQIARWQAHLATAIEQAKLVGLRELAYGAGHEINNPLTNISLRAQTLLRGELQPDQRKMLEAIHRQAFRAYEMIADMMLYAKPPDLELAEVELGSCVRLAVDQLADWAAQQGTVLTSRLPGDPTWIRADATQLQVALQALVRNALEACGRAGCVEVRLEPEHHGLLATVLVEDSGPGLSERARTHLFDPFFSGREAGRGLGFGLCKAQRIVQLHGGQIEVRSSSPRGTCLALHLPLVVPQSDAATEGGRFRVHG